MLIQQKLDKESIDRLKSITEKWDWGGLETPEKAFNFLLGIIANKENKDIRKLIIKPELLKEYKSVFTFLKNHNITFWSDLINVALSSAQKNFELTQGLSKKINELEKELKEKTREYKQHNLTDAIISLESAGYIIKIEAIPNAKKE